eukprot:TRINITY_DN10781_c0_g1_i1.p1 TRINITY_DN10781_c0_g1~~TRINITY_DN10781_c0_g1_i1.p1  ORF type:complete len:111 (+),score=1.03 TRINITY_DN10781_c0_g1_i1:164-496(+)
MSYYALYFIVINTLFRNRFIETDCLLSEYNETDQTTAYQVISNQVTHKTFLVQTTIDCAGTGKVIGGPYNAGTVRRRRLQRFPTECHNEICYFLQDDVDNNFKVKNIRNG